VREDRPEWPSNPEISSESLDDPSVFLQGCYYRDNGINGGRLFYADFKGGGADRKSHGDNMKVDKWYDCEDSARWRAAVVCEW
jgi:hypothetical protein